MSVPRTGCDVYLRHPDGRDEAVEAADPRVGEAMRGLLEGLAGAMVRGEAGGRPGVPLGIPGRVAG
jgi:hypothetical protein